MTSRISVALALAAFAAAATVGLVVPWGAYAASTDDSGLWVVGLVLLLAGVFVGVVVVLTVAERVLRPSSRELRRAASTDAREQWWNRVQWALDRALETGDAQILRAWRGVT